MNVSRLGWHFQNIPVWAGKTVNSDYVKLIDPPSSNPFPAARVIGRTYVPDNESDLLVSQGAAGAEHWFERNLPIYQRAPYAWAWEGPNEPRVADPTQRAALVQFTNRFVDLMHGINRKTVALNLSVGWPDVGCAGDLAGALARTDYWGVHEYSAPNMTDKVSWYCLRYRRTVEELRVAGSRIPPLIIGECGIDGGVIGRAKAGWRSFVNRGSYLSQLIWYDEEIRKDDYVTAAMIFIAGANPDWYNFEIDEPFSQELASYISYCGQDGRPKDNNANYLDMIRELAYRLRPADNPSAALARYAREHNLGAAITGEFDTCGYRAQGFERGIAYAAIGDWGNVKTLNW